ncbi:MAG: hypothetical protein MUE88_02305 [Flavobacteriales bacterium]|nr:hypothetical protein [Flavobacteriales bacterium]
MRSVCLIAALVGPWYLAHAQLNVSKPVVLNTPATAQVTGLNDPAQPSDPLTTGAQGTEAYRTASPTDGQVWAVQLPLLTVAPTPGLELRVQVPGPITAPVLLSVNGGPAVPVQRAPGVPLDGNVTMSESVLDLVYDGTSYQLINGDLHGTRPCPAGMVTVNGQYCIEPTNRSSATLEGASNICAALTRRLCTWAEFHVACARRIELGVTTTSNDWEWTSNTANEDLNARVVRLAGCGDAGTRNSQTVPAPYRCCYTR